jgi:hypothetical protein
MRIINDIFIVKSLAPFEEYSAKQEWIKHCEKIFCTPIQKLNSDDLDFLREEYNRLNGNQPSLSLIKEDVTWDDFIWCENTGKYMLKGRDHGSYEWDEKARMYMCTSDQHNEIDRVDEQKMPEPAEVTKEKGYECHAKISDADKHLTSNVVGNRNLVLVI